MNIFLTEEQYNIIKENIEASKISTKISDKIISDIDKNTTPFSDVLSQALLKKLFNQSYNNAKEEFSDNIENYSEDEIVNKLNKLIYICQKKEEKIKKQLEKLCCDSVLSLFDLGGTINIECNLVTEIGDNIQFNTNKEEDTEDTYQYDSVDMMNAMVSKELQRKFTNLLNIGVSEDLCNKLLDKLIGELFKLDEDLPHLYSKILKINQYLLFISNNEINDHNNFQSAYNKLEINNETDYNEVRDLKVYGIIFPFLLTETIRGCIDVFAINNLPNKRQEAELILKHCDILKDEPLYMMLGKTVWNRIIADKNIQIEDYQTIIDYLFRINTEEFNKLMMEILNNTKLGEEEINDIIGDAIRKRDYYTFLHNLRDKQKNNKERIDDEFFSEGEL